MATKTLDEWASEPRKYRQIVAASLKTKYGRGTGSQSAWEHMSETQQSDAFYSEGARLVLLQSESVSKTLTLADAKQLIRWCVTVEKDWG